MQILQPIYKSLRIIGLNSNQSIQKYPFNARNLTSLFTFGLNLVCDIGFLIYGAKDLKEFTDALYLTFTIVCTSSISIDLVWNMRQLFEFLGNLDDTINQRLMNPISKTIYTGSNQEIQKTARILNITLVGMSSFLLTVPPFLASLMAFFTTDLGADALQLPFPKWFPFDTKNLIGFLIAVAIEYIFVLNLNFLITSFMIVATGPNLILISITEDMICSLNTLNQNARVNKKESEIIQQFNELIQFHSNAKQLVNAFSKIMEFGFAIIFAWSILSICSTMVLVQIELQRGASYSELLPRCNEIFFAFSVVFVCCEFGHKLSKAVDQIDHVVGKLHWYKFPLHTRKMLPILIVGAQEPAVLRVFGNISCEREDFKNVFNAGFSNFMVVRKFEF